MKNARLIALILFVLVEAHSSPFRDFGFEDGIINVTNPPPFGGNGLTSQFIPGWVIISSINNTPQINIGAVNSVPFGNNQISLFDSSVRAFGMALPSEGKYYLGMTEPLDNFTFQQGHYSLIQRGDIPSNANSILFDQLSGVFDLSINGSQVSLFRTGGISLGANISGFSGQNAELIFTTESFQTQGQLPFFAIDNIRFSPNSVPEPSIPTLIFFGTLLRCCFGKK